jgi:hypothetical protein
MRQLLALSALMALVTGCMSVTYGRGNGLMWGGGGVALFVLIFIAAMLLGRQR